MKKVIGQCSHHDLVEMANFILNEWNKPGNREKTLIFSDYSSQFNKKQGIAWGVIVTMVKRGYVEAIRGIREVLAWGNDDSPDVKSFEYKLFDNASPEVRRLLSKLCGGK